MNRTKLGILISGRGSNLEALIGACREPDFPAEIALVISNRPGAYGLKRAAKADIPNIVIDHDDYESRDDFENAMDRALRDAGVELVCLAGFMRILNPEFVNRWRDRIINIHPSLLPSFKGLHVHERVLESGARFSGCTVHVVRTELDDGPIINQAVVPVFPDDTPKSLASRILEFEHVLYPEAVRLLASGEARVAGNAVKLTPGRKFHGEALINPLPRKTKD